MLLQKIDDGYSFDINDRRGKIKVFEEKELVSTWKKKYA